jgi:hypothetical protein
LKKSDAIAAVGKYITPKPCFITTDDGISWRPISGTGCAHFVAHQVGVVRGIKGSTACMQGYVLSVRGLTEFFTPLNSVKDVRPNDVWFNDAVFVNQCGQDHCGIVTDIGYDTDKQKVGQIIKITHCSNKQGGVVTNDWKVHFNKSGRFYRLLP